MDWLEASIIASRVGIEIIFFAMGACIYSFLNVVVYRLPRHMQFMEGKSMCPTCKHELAAKDLIPIFSWISLKGKCRYCGAPISVRYTVVEAIGGILAVVFTLLFGVKLMAAVTFLVSCVVTVGLLLMLDKVKGDL